MGQALAFAAIASSALIAGSAIGAWRPPPRQVTAVLLAFAGGAVLASLADTLMPEAYRDGGPYVAYATALGFLLSFLVSAA
jgi:ZIP family zinc transporter